MSPVPQPTSVRPAIAVAADWRCWRDPAHSVTTEPSLGWPRCADCGAAPHYWERSAMLDERLALNVYVPSGTDEGQRLAQRLVPGSAIVGLPDDSEVYFAGDIVGRGGAGSLSPGGSTDLRAVWLGHVANAADRLVTRYPTTGRTQVTGLALVRVGVLWPASASSTGSAGGRRGRFEATNDEALDAWLRR